MNILSESDIMLNQQNVVSRQYHERKVLKSVYVLLLKCKRLNMERDLQTSLRFTLLRHSTTIVVKIFQTSNKENNCVTFDMPVFSITCILNLNLGKDRKTEWKRGRDI